MADYIKKNEDKKVNFVRMPLKTNRVSMVDDRFKGEENKVEMRAVKRLLLAADGNETKLQPLNLANTADAIVAPENADKEIVGVQEAFFGNGIPGRIETSLIGHCAMLDAKEETGEWDFSSKIAARSLYEFDVQVKRSYSVTYNFKELVHIIRESSRRGGFFSRKTVNKLIDNRTTSSWLKFHTNAEDTEFTYTEEDIKKIKADFLDRALLQIIDIRTGGKASALALIDPSKSGAAVIGEELQKCPNIYCQIGAAGFRILDSIFGSASATSEVLKKLEGDVRETRSDVYPVRRYGVSVLKDEK